MVDHFTGLFSVLVFLVWLPMAIIQRPRFSRRWLHAILFIVLVSAFVPVNDLILLGYVRGVTGDISMLGMALFSLWIAQAYTGIRYLPLQQERLLGRGILLAALLMYPFAMGLGYWDSYAMGYGSITMLLIIAGVAVLLWWQEHWWVLSLYLLALVSAATGAMESDNIWNYLLDPWLVLALLWRGFQQWGLRSDAQSSVRSPDNVH